MVSGILRIFKRRKEDADCAEVRELSSDYIDEDLDQASTNRLRRHLEMCGPCNAFVNTLRATVRLLRNTPKHGAPDGFRQRVRVRLGEHRRT